MINLVKPSVQDNSSTSTMMFLDSMKTMPKARIGRCNLALHSRLVSTIDWLMLFVTKQN
jgi:hypothetical protein